MTRPNYSRQSTLGQPGRLYGEFSRGVQTLTLSVTASGDDADATVAGNISTTVTQGNEDQAFLFRGASALKGATIISAILRPTSSANQGGVNTFNLYLEDADNADPFTNGQAYSFYSGRPVTAAVSWPFNASLINNQEFDSPEIKTIVQAVVDRPSFGDRLHVLWKNNGVTLLVHHYDGAPSKVADLIIVYQLLQPPGPWHYVALGTHQPGAVASGLHQPGSVRTGTHQPGSAATGVL